LPIFVCHHLLPFFVSHLPLAFAQEKPQSCDKSCSRFYAKFLVTKTWMHHRRFDYNNLLAIDQLETFRVD
jgi:hypothetical protein